MKTFIAIFALALICVSAQKNDSSSSKSRPAKPMFNPWQGVAGCNLTTYPRSVNGSFCCASKPKYLMNKTLDDTCKAECLKSINKSEKWCCWTKCIMKQSGVVKANGTYDGPAAVAKLSAATNKTNVWGAIIKKVVDGCIADGPASVKKWESVTNKTASCDGALNKAINQCIKRQLFVQCPTAEKNPSANCTKLFAFATACPGYPIFDQFHGQNLNGQIVEKSVKAAKPNGNDDKKDKKNTKPSPTTTKKQATTQKAAPIPAKSA